MGLYFLACRSNHPTFALENAPIAETEAPLILSRSANSVMDLNASSP
jgi:hypothetical protein